MSSLSRLALYGLVAASCLQDVGAKVLPAQDRVAPADDPIFYLGLAECVVVRPSQALAVGARLRVVMPGRSPVTAVASRVGPWTRPPKAAVAPPCDRHFEAGLSGDTILISPTELRIATITAHPPPAEPDIASPYFALAASRRGTVIGGPPTQVGTVGLAPLVAVVRRALPPGWPPAAVLYRAVRFGPAAGHTVTELYAGLPTRPADGPPGAIAHIAVARYFFVDGRLRARERYERATGVEERVDTEPPTLTDDTWWVSDTELTAGYLQRAAGAEWERLVINGGFEGINWIAVALRPGLPERFRVYLYTHH